MTAKEQELREALENLKNGLVEMVGYKTANSMWAYHDAMRLLEE